MSNPLLLPDANPFDPTIPGNLPPVSALHRLPRPKLADGLVHALLTSSFEDYITAETVDGRKFVVVSDCPVVLAEYKARHLTSPYIDTLGYTTDPYTVQSWGEAEECSGIYPVTPENVYRKIAHRSDVRGWNGEVLA